jgi:hypothetical protein
MAKNKEDTDSAAEFWAGIKRTADKFDKQNPLVGTKYIVVEGFYKGNEYDYNIDWFERARFEFDTLDERNAWLEDHEPDKYNKFRLARQDVREFHPAPYINRMPMMWERNQTE